MKTIVMTGATSGLGLAAADTMRQVPDVRLLVGARGEAAPGAGRLPLDLACLGSVRGFAAAVEESLGASSIDGLVLNAGVQFGNADGRTEDGFEPTFAVNHLAHYLLLRLLMPRLAPGAIVLITTSDMHDPKINWLAPPEHAQAERLAHGQLGLNPESQASRAGVRAYATSKLCNLLTAAALASSPFAKERALHVLAFNPGWTPGTQLARSLPRAIRFLFSVLMPILTPFLRPNTVAGGGQLLADLALGTLIPPAGRLYASQVKRQLTWPAPSDLACDETVKTSLWRDSAALVGLPAEA